MGKITNEQELNIALLTIFYYVSVPQRPSTNNKRDKGFGPSKGMG